MYGTVHVQFVLMLYIDVNIIKFNYFNLLRALISDLITNRNLVQILLIWFELNGMIWDKKERKFLFNTFFISFSLLSSFPSKQIIQFRKFLVFCWLFDKADTFLYRRIVWANIKYILMKENSCKCNHKWIRRLTFMERNIDF